MGHLWTESSRGPQTPAPGCRQQPEPSSHGPSGQAELGWSPHSSVDSPLDLGQLLNLAVLPPLTCKMGGDGAPIARGCCKGLTKLGGKAPRAEPSPEQLSWGRGALTGQLALVWQDFHFFPGQHFPRPRVYALGKWIWILALYGNRSYRLWNSCWAPYAELGVSNTFSFVESSFTPDDGHSLACLD